MASERETLLAQAKRAVPHAETEYEAVDGYARIIYQAINETLTASPKSDVSALKDDYAEVNALRDELFQQEVMRMSEMRVIGGVCV